MTEAQLTAIHDRIKKGLDVDRKMLVAVIQEAIHTKRKLAMMERDNRNLTQRMLVEP